MKKVTPTYTLDWYIKWAASIILILGMILSSHNIFPANIIAQSTGALGWLIVGILWNDRAIIIINSIAFIILVNGVVRYYI
tara:strand:+ start:5348 stop:5590 length:243 start_codon:yes stop_codon:yes gene_type:complete